MHMVDQRCPHREDSIPPTMEEQKSLKPADTEIEMDISTKLPPKMPDVLLVENFRIALANVRIGLTNRQQERRKLPRPENRMSDR